MDQLAKPSHTLSPDLLRGESNEKPMVLARGFAPGLVRKPHVDGIMSSAYIILQMEMDRLLGKAQREGLTATESQTLERYINSLKKLASEEREQRTADRIEDLSDEELRAELRKSLGEGK